MGKLLTRIDGPVCTLWRQYQTELRERGVSKQAEELYSRLHVMLDLDNEDGDLPSMEPKLHARAYARYPAQRRPSLISSRAVYVPAANKPMLATANLSNPGVACPFFSSQSLDTPPG
jgi:hypothetical protein